MSETRYQREIHGRIYHQWQGGWEWIESSSFRLSRRRTKFGRRGGSKSCVSAFILPGLRSDFIEDLKIYISRKTPRQLPRENAYNNPRCWINMLALGDIAWQSPYLRLLAWHTMHAGYTDLAGTGFTGTEWPIPGHSTDQWHYYWVAIYTGSDIIQIMQASWQSSQNIPSIPRWVVCALYALCNHSEFCLINVCFIAII